MVRGGRFEVEVSRIVQDGVAAVGGVRTGIRVGGTGEKMRET